MQQTPTPSVISEENCTDRPTLTMVPRTPTVLSSAFAFFRKNIIMNPIYPPPLKNLFIYLFIYLFLAASGLGRGTRA